MENIRLVGRAISWERKTIKDVCDGVVEFEDGDWFNAVTGSGVHRYGTLVVTGKSVIAREDGDSTETRRGVYRMSYPPKR